MLNYISIAVLPLIITAIIGWGLMKRQPVFEYFVDGAKEGIKTSIGILPSLVGLLAAVSMLRASGAMDIISNLLAPALDFIGYPKELVPLALMRPVSGSGSLAIVKDLINNFGADSFIGRCASVMMGSTETTFYTFAVYFGSVGIKNTRYTIKAALLADLAGTLAAVMAVKMLL